MRTLRLALVAFGLALLSTSSFAQTAVTATCKDGTNFSGASRRGACARHGGVQAFGDTAGAVTPAVPAGNGVVANPLTTATPSAPARPTAQATPVAPQPAFRPSTRAAPAAVAGAGGQVWVNSESKVYHCAGTRFYGKTKAGSYMSEVAAKAEGDRPSRGKTCS